MLWYSCGQYFSNTVSLTVFLQLPEWNQNYLGLSDTLSWWLEERACNERLRIMSALQTAQLDIKSTGQLCKVIVNIMLLQWDRIGIIHLVCSQNFSKIFIILFKVKMITKLRSYQPMLLTILLCCLRDWISLWLFHLLILKEIDSTISANTC